MNDLTFTSPADNIWWVQGSTPDYIVDELTLLSKDAVEKKLPIFNRELAGFIKKEYKVTHTQKFNTFLTSTYFYYLKQIRKITKEKKLIYNNNIEVSKQWINLQSKFESNPIHTHSGVISYVFWHKIPYTHKEEKEACEGGNDNPADFRFVYSNSNNLFDYTNKNSTRYLIFDNLEIYKNMENTFCIFPAWLAHSVGQFTTSDEYRITFSGNFLNSEPKKTESTLL